MNHIDLIGIYGTLHQATAEHILFKITETLMQVDQMLLKSETK